MIKGQDPDDVGRYAGWGTENDSPAAAGEGERVGPAMLPFLRYRPTDRWWKLAIGFVYLPAVVVIVSLEAWLNFDQSLIWISLGVFYAVFLAAIYLSQRK